jgi:cytochrome c6
MNRLYIFTALLLVFSCTIEKKTDDSDSVSPKLSGKEIFSERCTSCHGMDGKLGFGGAKDLTASKKTLEEIIHQVTFGKGAMAPYKNILSVQDIQSVSEYALTLRK